MRTTVSTRGSGNPDTSRHCNDLVTRRRLLTGALPAEVAGVTGDSHAESLSGELLELLDFADVMVWAQVQADGQQAIETHPIYQRLP